MKIPFLFLLVISQVFGINYPIEIYLIRHGETAHNVNDKSQNHLTPLNANGKQQAQALGKEFAALDIHKIYCSDYVRTTQTANLFAHELNADVEIIQSEKLREGDKGNWKNSPPSEMYALRKQYRIDHGQTKQAWVTFKGDGSLESYEEMYTRLKNLITESIVPDLESNDSPIILITHGMVMVSTLYHHLEYDQNLGFGVSNCGWIKLGLNEDGSFKLLDKHESKIRTFPFP
ncbi:MAG: phosphoglycerate mutase GpmB [Chlamydiia bacterium]|nr:phosphoglycerate mutase GpmB [Chlamydiia bacterium]